MKSVKIDEGEGILLTLWRIFLVLIGRYPQTKLGLSEMLKISTDLEAASEKVLKAGSDTLDEATKELLNTAVISMTAAALKSTAGTLGIPMTVFEEAKQRTRSLQTVIVQVNNAHSAVMAQAEDEIETIKRRVEESKKSTENVVISSTEGIKSTERALVFCGEGA